MPSPFPGMDPYLEHPEFFPDLHDNVLFYLREFLQARLPAPYYVQSRSRAWIEYTHRTIEPDVSVQRGPQPSTGTPAEIGMGTAVLVRPSKILVPQEEIREPFLEIHTVQGERQLVTAIELLSLTNKRSNSEGGRLYRDKQRELLHSQVNLVEIDLLRGGEHTTAVSLDEAVSVAGSFDYHICVHKMDELGQFYVYAIRLEQSLAQIVIPLLPGDGGIAVELQTIFDRYYDSGPYQRINPYRRRRPEPPLTSEQTLWAENLLRERGLLE